MSDPSTAPSEAEKERLVAQFRAYLEQSESVRPEDAAGEGVDLYTLFTELAALRNEVKLESRQVKGALDQFRDLFEVVEHSHRRLDRELERGREANRRMLEDCERGVLLAMVDLRDRIEAGLDSARGYRPSFPRACKRREASFIQALAEGMDITLRRLDETLAGYGVSPVEAPGRPLDPHTMRAAGTETHPELDNGIVLSEVRKGFLHRGEVLRLAEVVVNKRESTQ